MKQTFFRALVTRLLCLSFILNCFVPLTLHASPVGYGKITMPVVARLGHVQETRAPRLPLPLGSGTGNVGTPPPNVLNTVTPPLPTDVNIVGDLTVGGKLSLSQMGITLLEVPENGQDGVTLQAAADMPASYTLRFPSADGTPAQRLTTDGYGNLYWDSPGSGSGFQNGGNAFGVPAILGTLDNYGLTIRTGVGTLPAKARMIFASTGAITVPAMVGTDSRYVSADSTGALSSLVPVGTKNVIYVIKDTPVVVGKYYPDIKSAVDWANSNATEPTSIWIEAGYHHVSSTIAITNPMVRSITGESVGGSVIVPDNALVGLPVFLLNANYGVDVFTIQDLSIDGRYALGYQTMSGSIGILMTGTARFGLVNIIVQGCYRGIVADAATVPAGGQIVVLSSCYTLLSGDCGLLVDNGSCVTATDFTSAWATNQEVRIQRTSALAPMTEVTLVASWLTDDVGTAVDGLLAKDLSGVIIESSRIYNVRNAIVVEGDATIASLGNLHVGGMQTHYKQVDGTAHIQASGDFVADTSPAKFFVTDPTNVYFDVIDTVSNLRKIGNMTNTSVPVFSILTGADTGDPSYGYKKDWFGYRGELFEMPAGSMVGADNAGRALCAVNKDALLISFVRGDHAQEKESGLVLGTYNSNGDPVTPDYTLARAWQIYKSPVPETQNSLFFSSFNGMYGWNEQIAMTVDAKMGIGTTQPMTRLQLGSGQLSAARGDPVQPTYTFVGDLDTGLYSPGANSVGLSTNGLAALIANSDQTITIPSLTPLGVVHNDASGKLSTALITNPDVSPSAAIADTKLGTIQTPGKVANSATTATSLNVSPYGTIVARDSSGNFSAGMITANLTGTVTGSVIGSATNFTGPLVGDVTGTQGATVVSSVGGQSASHVASGVVAANAATDVNTFGTIVKRDASGNFAASTITASLAGNVTGNVTGNVSGSAASFTGSLAGDVTGTQSLTHVASVGGVTAANVASGANLANAATDTNTANAIVKRDALGNFSAGTITANVTGHASQDLQLSTGGTVLGPLTMGNQQQLRLAQPTPGSFYVALQAPTSPTASYTLNLPTSAGTAGYVLTTDGNNPASLSWQPTGVAAGYVLTQGNPSSVPLNIGTDNSSPYAFNLITHGTPQLSISSGGTVGLTSLAGTGDRVVQAGSTGALSAILPMGTKNVIQVIKDLPTDVDGKYYSTLMAAVTWANGHAAEPTTIVIEPGVHTITSTITITNPYIMAITGNGAAATILVPSPGLVGSPMISLPQLPYNTPVFTMQNLAIDATSVPAYMTTGGSIGVYVSGTSYYGFANMIVQGCYQNMFVDGQVSGPSETISLTNCYLLLSGDCGLLVDNGGYVLANNVTVSYSGNQDICVQTTHAGTQRTQVSLVGCWISGIGTGDLSDGILAKDDAYALVSASRVYNIKNAFVAQGTAQINTVGNPRVSGNVTHYSQLSPTAHIQAVNDVVNGVDISKFSVSSPANVYFDVIDGTTNIRHTGKMTNTTFEMSSVLTGNGANDPIYNYVNNWFGYTGQVFELSEAALGGLKGVQSLTAHNSDAFTSSFIRGLNAHEYTAGVILGTYASDGDPSTPDWSLARSWRLNKRPLDHALQATEWNGTQDLTPLVLTAAGNLGLDATGALTTPTSQLQLGSGQIAVPLGSTGAPSYSFTGDLNTGIYSPGANSVALATNGAAALIANADQTITISSLTPAGVVHNNGSGKLSSSLIVNGDITSGTIQNAALATQSSANNANYLVARDTSGNFSAGTITAALTGAASANVLKIGDTMSGALTLNNAQLILKNGSGNTIALQAPSSVPTNYTLNLPASFGTAGYVLTTDGANPAILSWQPTGVAAGYVLTQGNPSSVPLNIGTDSSSPYAVNLITHGTPQLSISSGGTVGMTSLAGTADRVVQAGATGALSAILPTGIKNVIQVIKDLPTDVDGKYYSTLMAAVDWANTHAAEPTAIVIAAGNHAITSTITITNPYIMAIAGEGTAATRLVAGPALTTSPVLVLSQTTSAFTLQDFIIDGTGIVTGLGNIGISMTGTSYFALINVLVQGCYRGIAVDGFASGGNARFALSNCYVLLSGDCALLADNGAYLVANNVTIAYSGNQEIRVQKTNVAASQTRAVITASWLTDVSPTTDGVLATDGSSVLVSSSRVFDVRNAFVVSSGASLSSVGNPQVGGLTAHYVQADGTSRIQATGDVVAGAASTKFSVTNPTNVYFDVTDGATNVRHTGRMSNTTCELASLLIGKDADDPNDQYISNWLGFRGEGFEINQAALQEGAGQLSGVTGISAIDGDAYNSSLVRGLSADSYTAGLVLATYATDQDPTSPIISLANSWRLVKRPTDHAFQMTRFQGSSLTYLTPFVLTAAGNLGLDATGVLTTPTSQLQLGSGQIAVPLGNSPAPSYSFTGDLNTGLFSPGADSVALSTAGVARLTAGATGTITVPSLTPLGVVHNDGSGNLSSSLVTNADIIAGAGISDTKLATIATPLKVSNSATTATSANVLSPTGTIVMRDASGNFSATTITANLTGNATTATNATTAVNFSGSLAGNVTGTQGATVVASVGGQLAADVAAATVLANNATDVNTASTIVKRDGFGNFSASTITASLSGNATTATTATNFSGSLAGNVTGTQGATVVASVGGVSAANVASGANLANAASTGTPGTIVLRNGSGDFSAGTITASLTGHASLDLPLTGGTLTGPGALTLSGAGADLTVGGTSYLQAAQTAGLLSVNNGATFALGVPGIPAQEIQVTKGTISGPNQYNSIKEAIDDITDASAVKPYAVYVGPGLFVEDTITLKSYVALVGASSGSTIIQTSHTNQDVIVGAPYAIMTDVTIVGATDTGRAGVRFHGGGQLNVKRVTIKSCNIGIFEDGLTAPYSFILLENTIFDSNAVFVTGIQLDGATYANPVYMKIATLTWLVQSNASFIALLDVAGPNTIMVSNAIDAGAATGLFGGVGCQVSNGATFSMQSSTLHGFATGISVPNSGSGPVLNIMSVSGSNNYSDISVLNAATTGTINGVFDDTKVTIDSGASISIFFSDPVSAGTVTAGPLYQGSSFDNTTNISNQIQQGANLGLLHGGVFTEATTGTPPTIDVAAGDGYVMTSTPVFPNNNLKYVSWGLQTGIALTANADNYIYIDENGVACTTTAIPDPTSTIFLGKMRTNSTDEVFCERNAATMVHTASQLDYSWREALGPVYVSGSITSQDATPLRLDVTQGRYFFGTHEYKPDGGTPIAGWIAFYRNPPNNYTVIDPQTLIDYEHYDDGSGTLALLTADIGLFARHALYVVNGHDDEYYLLVYGQEAFESEIDAVNGGNPPMPSTWTGDIAIIASIIVENTGVPATGIKQVRDERPRLAFQASGVTPVTNHGSLSGLANDDHTQYVLTNGGRLLTGNLQMNSNNITGVGLIYTTTSPATGVDVAFHASRHGANSITDPLPTAAPITIGTANAAGSSNSFSRADHVHAHGVQTDGSLHAVATTSVDGFMSAADKIRLDSINPALFVLNAGDTMTGPLAINSASTTALTVGSGPVFTVSGATGNTAIVGTLGVTSDFAINTNKFNVTALTGDTTIAGTLGVTGATTLTNLTTVSGGVVHASPAGLLTSSAVVDGDIALGTIANNKLATISSINTPGNIVVRDGVDGGFAAGTIAATGVDVSGLTVTLNKGAGSAIGALAGILVDDSVGSASGYFRTNGSATSWVLKPPAVVGTITFTPGGSGLTINQSSHDSVTLGTATNGLSLAIQVLSLAAANGSTTGALTSSDWTTFSSKQNGSANLTSLAGISTNGFVAYTGSNTFAPYTLTGTTDQVSITNGSGGGNPVFSLPQSIATTSTPTFGSLTLAATPQAQLRLEEDLGTGLHHYVALQAPASVTPVSYTITLPAATSAAYQVLMATDTSGTLAWTTNIPGYALTSGNTIGAGTMYLGTNDNFGLTLRTNNTDRIQIANSGGITVPGFASVTAGVVHSSTSGLLTSSQIINADISTSAAITDDKLFTISTSGKVANSATTATTSNSFNTIVLRDGVTGGFSAGTISATFSGNLTGSVTGAASANVLKIGDTMSGNLTMADTKQIQLTGGANYVALQAPASVTPSSYTLRLPAAVPGTSGAALVSDTSGNLSWSAFAPTGNYFVNNGNSFAAPAELGTNDDYSLSFETNNIPHLIIANSTGAYAITAATALYADGGIDRSTGSALNIGNVNATAVNIGTAGSAVTTVGIGTGSNVGTINIGTSGTTTNVNLSGVTTAITGSTAASIDTAAAGTVSLGNTNAATINVGTAASTGITIGRAATTNTNVYGATVNLGTSAGTAVYIGNGTTPTVSMTGVTTSVDGNTTLNLGNTTAETINMGTTASTGITIGRNNAAATTTINGGVLQLGNNATTSVGLGNGTAPIVNIGNIGAAVGIAGLNTTIDAAAAGTLKLGDATAGTIKIGTAAPTANSISIGNSVATSSVTIDAPTLTLGNTSATSITMGRPGATVGITGATATITGNTTASMDTAAAGTLNLGNTNAQFVNLGRNNASTTDTIAGGTINIGTGSANTGVTIGGLTTTTTLNISGTQPIILGNSTARIDAPTLTLGNTAGTINIGSGAATTVQMSGVGITVSGTNTIVTGSSGVRVDGGAVNLGTVSATGITIGGTNVSGTTAVDGVVLTLGGSAANTVALGRDNAATVSTTVNGKVINIGTGTATTSINIGTTPSTANVSIGNTTGTVSFTALNTTIDAAAAGTLKLGDATAGTVKIGTATAATNTISMGNVGKSTVGITGLTTTVDGVALNLGTVSATGITIGGTNVSGTISLDGTTVNLGTTVNGNTITIGKNSTTPTASTSINGVRVYLGDGTNTTGIAIGTGATNMSNGITIGASTGITAIDGATVNLGNTNATAVNLGRNTSGTTDTIAGAVINMGTGNATTGINIGTGSATTNVAIGNTTGTASLTGVTATVTGGTTATVDASAVNIGTTVNGNTITIGKNSTTPTASTSINGVRVYLGDGTNTTGIAIGTGATNMSNGITIGASIGITAIDGATVNLGNTNATAVNLGRNASGTTDTIAGAVINMGTGSATTGINIGTSPSTTNVTIGNATGTTGLTGTTIGLTGATTITGGLALANQGTLQLQQASPGTNFVGLQAPNSVSSSLTYVLPSGAGTSGQVLTTAGTATTDILTWTTVQAASANLASLAGISTNGFIAYTGSNTFAPYTLTGTTDQVSITNGSGGGNPVFSLPQSIAMTSTPTFGRLTLAATPQAQLRLEEDLGTGLHHYVALQAPASVTPASYTITLPANTSATNQVLMATDNLGTLAWTTTIPGYALTSGNSVTSLMYLGTTTNYGLTLETNGSDRIRIANDGTLTVPGFASATAGVVHSDTSGILSSSQIVNADISATANIADTKLATISTAGKVANGATTATTAATGNTIVLRDPTTGGFSAGMITANLTGDVTGTLTGHATLDLPLIGGTLTNNLTMANGKQILFTQQNPGSATAALEAPATVSTSYILYLPTAVTTVSGAALVSDLSGNLSWSSAPAGNYFVNNGNSFDTAAVLGTLDANSLSFVTGTGGPNTRLSIAATGTITASTAFYADGGLDVTEVGVADTLNIGPTNADIVNVGRSAGTVNIKGETTFTDKLVTLNKGGLAASAGTAGIELEENSLITGYVETSADRNSWTLKAPNTAGIVTVTPGAGGFTIDQGSHNPVTIGTANGLSLSTQQLSLAAANGSTTGALSSGDWTIFNGKQAGSANLTSLAGISTNGFIAYTGSNTFAPYTLTGTTNQVSITNGSGGGNPVFSLPQNIHTGATPTFAGLTINTGAIYANGGLDVTEVGVADTLNIGPTNADIVNVGKSAGTVNIKGETTFTDKLVTLNKGGLAASAGTAGIELEENSSITGYAETSADRNSWTLKAPNTAGIVTVTPGAGGFTIDQGSHNPVTIGTANGLSLSTQQLSLAAANGSTTGALSSGDWTIFNGKQAGSANLTSLAGISTNGFIAYTGSNTFAPYTLTGTTNQVSITNGSGGGNPVFSLPQNIHTGATPTFAGLTINTGAIYANGGLDVTEVGVADTLNIGPTNADIVNVGKSAGTVNIKGETTFTDKLVTLNKGGLAASAGTAGIELEENSSITGYVETSADRNSWTLKAPNTAGIVTVTPGAGGFTIDQGSHNPVTIGTANGLSLSTQQLSLAAANGSTTGALSSGDWTIFNGKQAGSANLTSLAGISTNGFIAYTGSNTFAPYTLTGTTNQVSITNGSGGGNPVFSLPQNIHTGATPTFAGLTLANQGSLQLQQASPGTTYVGLQAPATVASSLTYVLPATAGTSGQVLTTNGASPTVTLSWTSGAGTTAFVNNGNTGFAPAILGTLDANSLSFVTGTSGPNTRMSIAATGEITANTRFNADGNIDTSLAATALNLGTATTNNVNVGMNSSGKTTTIDGATVNLGNGSATTAVNIGTGATTASNIIIGRNAATTPTATTTINGVWVYLGDGTNTTGINIGTGATSMSNGITIGGTTGTTTVDGATARLGYTNATAVNIGRAAATVGITGSAIGLTGVTTVSNGATAGKLQLQQASGTNYVGLQAPAAVGTSYTLTFPGVVGASGQVLKTTDASGTLGWDTAALNGGNTLGAALTLGTNDAQALNLETNGATRLNIDSAGNTTYSTNYKVSAYRLTTDQAIGAAGIVIFNTESLDPDNKYNTGTGVYTASYTGYYLVSANVCYFTTSNGLHTIQIRKNGTAIPGQGAQNHISAQGAGRYWMLNYSGIVQLNAGQTLDVYYTGTNAADTIRPDYSSLHIHYMST